MQNYKYLNFLVIWSVATIIIVNVTAGKLVNFFGVPLSITIYIFPLIYVIADVLTEVYGYAVARQVLWITLFTRILSAIVLYLVAIAPPADIFQHNDAYKTILGVAPQIAVGGTIAVFAGDIVNNYVLAKMKVYFEGRLQKTRLVVSTLAGEFVNTIFFYGIALYGILPMDKLLMGIIMGSVAKTVVEIVMLPVTTKIIAFLKKEEGIDHYDRNTDFNPFKL